MTDTTESQAKAIAESLGWNLLIYDGDDNTSAWWFHSRYGQLRGARAPRLTDDTTLGHAMCYDAIVWLSKRDWKLGYLHSQVWRAQRGDDEATPFYNAPVAAIEAAMIQELEK